MSESPKIIFWETTKQCNLKCGFCRVVKSETSPELTRDEAIKLIIDIKENFPDVLLVLSGGEPFLRRDIFDILSHTFSIGLKTSLATNGTLLCKNEAVMLKKFGVKRVSISLDSAEETFHDMSRGICGSYRKALHAASVLKNEKIPFQINFTVTRSNRDEIINIAELSCSLGARALHYFVLVAVGCGIQLKESEMLDAGETEKALRAIRMVSQESPMEIRPTCAPQYVRFDEEGGYSGCLAASSVFFISSEGEIFPCGYLPMKAGSIREGSIGDVWNDSEVFTTLRQNGLKGACAACAIKDKCRGCRARAFSRTGDYMAEDDSCLAGKQRWTVKIEN